MSKTKSIYFCQNCGNQSPKWMGKCPVCNEWNTYVEEAVDKTEEMIDGANADLLNQHPLCQVLVQKVLRFSESLS